MNAVKTLITRVSLFTASIEGLYYNDCLEINFHTKHKHRSHKTLLQKDFLNKKEGSNIPLKLCKFIL